MYGYRFLIALAGLLCLADAGSATIVVDPGQPITHRVTVQMIQTALDDGLSPATVFGNAMQRANIESVVDTIWAQAGIDVEFLSTIVSYNDTFAYQGNAGSGTRPSGDLDTIFANANAEGGILNPDPAILNTIFVNVVPSFPPLSENTAAGYAHIGDDGITQFVGDSLLTFQNGRDVIASVVAHEIGHNLGLKHPANGLPNLMSPNGTSQQLSSAQIEAIFQTTFRNDSVAFIPSGGTGFPQLLPQLAGDYNEDGIVDAADYTVWRDHLDTPSFDLPNEGATEGIVTEEDFNVWREHFGNTSPGNGASAEPPFQIASAVPEPQTRMLLAFALVALLPAVRAHQPLTA